MPVPEGMGDDCDDADATVFPGAVDTWYDGVDSDCGGEDDCDIDRDGFQPIEGVCGPADGEAADCNDHDPEINPGVVEICASDVDENCDGDTVGVDAPDCTNWYQDLDSDGFGVSGSEVCQCAPSFPYTAPEGGDCNDFDSFFRPDGFEIPRDGRDHDCSGDDDYDWENYDSADDDAPHCPVSAVPSRRSPRDVADARSYRLARPRRHVAFIKSTPNPKSRANLDDVKGVGGVFMMLLEVRNSA